MGLATNNKCARINFADLTVVDYGGARPPVQSGALGSSKRPRQTQHKQHDLTSRTKPFFREVAAYGGKLAFSKLRKLAISRILGLLIHTN